MPSAQPSPICLLTIYDQVASSSVFLSIERNESKAGGKDSFVIIQCWQLVFKVITLKVFRSKNVTAPHSMSLQLPTSVSHSRVALALEGYDGHQEHLQERWQGQAHGWGH